jgi:hypothetical protein
MLINVFFQLPSTLFNMSYLHAEFWNFLPYFLSHMVRYFIGRKIIFFCFLNNIHYMIRVNPCPRNLVSLNMLSMSCWIQVQKIFIQIYCLRIRGCLWKTQAVDGTYQILFFKKISSIRDHKLVFSKKKWMLVCNLLQWLECNKLHRKH